MSIIVLTSASGAPGVTTTTLGLACTWGHEAIAVEADPVGGSAMLAGFFRGFQPPSQSLVDLLMAHRAGRLSEQFPSSLIPVKGTKASVLPGPRSHAQARSAQELWEPLSMVWRTLGSSDVFIDAGRLGMESYPEPLLKLADLVLLVTRSDLPSLAAAKRWADQAAESRQFSPDGGEWAVALVGKSHPYSSSEVAEVLGLPVLFTLVSDRRGASVFSTGRRLRGTSRLSRDLVRAGELLRSRFYAADQLLRGMGGGPVHTSAAGGPAPLVQDDRGVGMGGGPVHTMAAGGPAPLVQDDRGVGMGGGPVHTMAAGGPAPLVQDDRGKEPTHRSSCRRQDPRKVTEDCTQDATAAAGGQVLLGRDFAQVPTLAAGGPAPTAQDDRGVGMGGGPVHTMAAGGPAWRQDDRGEGV